MQPENQTDHIALLALMLCGTLIKRLSDLGQIDQATGQRLHHLVNAVRTHAQGRDLHDLRILFENLDLAVPQNS